MTSPFLNDFSPTNPLDFYNSVISLYYSHTFIPLSLYSHCSPPCEIPPPLLYQSFDVLHRPHLLWSCLAHNFNFTEKDQEKWSSLPRVHMVKRSKVRLSTICGKHRAVGVGDKGASPRSHCNFRQITSPGPHFLIYK